MLDRFRGLLIGSLERCRVEELVDTLDQQERVDGVFGDGAAPRRRDSRLNSVCENLAMLPRKAKPLEMLWIAMVVCSRCRVKVRCSRTVSEVEYR